MVRNCCERTHSMKGSLRAFAWVIPSTHKAARATAHVEWAAKRGQRGMIAAKLLCPDGLLCR